MKIFSVNQVREWDTATINSESISSFDLMERAAVCCYKWIAHHSRKHHRFHIFCSNGNNGGDGLALARMLIQNYDGVYLYIIESTKKESPDFTTNLASLQHYLRHIYIIRSPENFPDFQKNDIIIDAIFGTGLNKPLDGIIASLVAHINKSQVKVISIDIPTGLFADRSSKGNNVIMATHTLTFQNYKLALLLAENAQYTGQLHILDIGLDKQFEKTTNCRYELTELVNIKIIYRPRKAFSHKGNYGFAAIIAGSYGMMGAAVLATGACLRSGVGKLSCLIPACGYDIIQADMPEAMCQSSGQEYISTLPELSKFTSVGIGPGIGRYASHNQLLKELFENYKKPTVIDADALNILAENTGLLKSVPQNSILTPHPGEFIRLFGSSENQFDQLELALEKSKEMGVIIILKGHNTFIATPGGKGYFNSTGNSGMATGGSGDVLTGILTALLAQGYDSMEAAILGVYIHGLAGDIAAQQFSQEGMIAGDIIQCLGTAFKQIS